MRIGFDVSPLHRPHPLGVVRATRGLVEALERRGRHEIVRLVPPTGRDLLRWRQIDLPVIERDAALFGIHSPVSAFTLRGTGRRFQTLHELPWLHGVDENAGWRHRAWARFGPRRARRVFTPTAFVARDVQRESGVDSSAIVVAPWGVDAVFLRTTQGLSEPRDQSCPYVLAPGAGRVKKNLTALVRGVEAYERRSREHLRITVTGELDRLTSALVEASRARVEIEHVPWVDDESLAPLVRDARAVAVLSHSEGFGFPALEALACGTSAIVTRSSAQAEVAGAVGIAVDADDPEDVARGLEGARAALPQRAERRAHAERFTWDACAALVERAWEESA